LAVQSKQQTVEIRQATSVHWKSWDAQFVRPLRDSAFFHLQLAGAGFQRAIGSRVPKRKFMQSTRPAPDSSRLATPRVAVRTCMAAIADAAMLVCFF